MVRDLNGDKEPGSDGFTMTFFQKCGGVLKQDIMALFSKFHNRRGMLLSLHRSDINLIVGSLSAHPSGHLLSYLGT